MNNFINGAIICDILSIFLILPSLPSVLGLTEAHNFPLPVFNDVTYDFRDVIVRPASPTSLTMNVTLCDMETNAFICNLTSSLVTDFHLFSENEECEVRPGLAILSSAEVDVFISFSGYKSPIPPLHKMGVKYIFPEDFDKHQADRSTSLLIYTAARNTTVDLCVDRLTGGHLSAEFNIDAQKRFDGKLECYRANLARDDIWMINNASLPGGIEVSANNPVAVLCGHLSNKSRVWKNGQAVDDSETPKRQITWGILPPLKFWGTQFILFPRGHGGLQNVFVISEHKSKLLVNSSNNLTIFNIPARNVWLLAVQPSTTDYITLWGTSKMTMFSYECSKTKANDTIVRYFDAVDSLMKFNYTAVEGTVGITVVCSSIMQTWLLPGSNSSAIYPIAYGKIAFGNTTVYYATFPYANKMDVIYVNLTSDNCFLQRPLQSYSGMDPSCIIPNCPETIEDISRAVKFDNSHHRNASEKDLSGMGSKVIIGVHINDNVNKSSERNVYDMSLYGNKTENSISRPDIKVANNQTEISYLQTTKIDGLLADTSLSKTNSSEFYTVTSSSTSDRFGISSTSASTIDYTRWPPKVLSTVTNMPIKEKEYKLVKKSSTDISSSAPPSGTSDSSRWFSKVFYTLTNISNQTKGYQRTASSLSDTSTTSPRTNVTNSDSGTSGDIGGSTSPYRTDKTRLHTTDIPDKFINGLRFFDSDRNTSRYNNLSHGPLVDLNNHSSAMINTRQENKSTSINEIDIIHTNRTLDLNQTSDNKHVYSGTKNMLINSAEFNNVSDTVMQNKTRPTKHSRNYDPYSNKRFKVVLDMTSKGSNANTRMRYDEKNPSYTHQGSAQGTQEQVEDGKSLVAVVVSLSAALFAVIAIILVFFFIEYFSRRNQIRKTRIRPFLSDY